MHLGTPLFVHSFIRTYDVPTEYHVQNQMLGILHPQGLKSSDHCISNYYTVKPVMMEEAQGPMGTYSGLGVREGSLVCDLLSWTG